MKELKKEKKVYLIRHGESEENISSVFQSPQSPLSELGKEQVKQIAERVSFLNFDALISSPYKRAKETAEKITRVTGKKAEFCDLFKERVKPTSINGKLFTDSIASEKYNVWEKSVYESGDRVEDGENFEDIIDRSDNALTFLEDHREDSLVVVTHGYFLRVIVARILIGENISGEILKRFLKTSSMRNTGITVLSYNPEDPYFWRLLIHNDHAHLGC